MVELPANTVTQADLDSWYKLQEELKRVKAAEILLRNKIFKFFFPNPTEGTNDYPLADSWVLKGKYNITRDVDIASFQALREQFAEAGIQPDTLIKWKPELKITNYRELTAEQANLFDQCLIVKPGSPALEIVLPKKRGKNAEAIPPPGAEIAGQGNTE